VGIPFQRCGFYLLQQFCKRRITSYFVAQRQCIDKKANHSFQFLLCSIGYWTAYADILLAAIFIQQHF
jgi:hypothetical protein